MASEILTEQPNVKTHRMFTSNCVTAAKRISPEGVAYLLL